MHKVLLGTAPTMLSFLSPFLKIRIVGMLRIPNFDAIFGQSSVLTLQQVSFPANSFASSSITGAIILHGPHHGAQNSTRTGLALCFTTLSQLSSVTTTTTYQSYKYMSDEHHHQQKQSAIQFLTFIHCILRLAGEPEAGLIVSAV